MSQLKRGLFCMAAILSMATVAVAADIGGNCCSDLEERIAELEATTAQKGNRKVKLTVYGQVNKALLAYDIEGEQDVVVTENSAAESLVGFAGTAILAPQWQAGFVIELGVGGYDDSLQSGVGYGPLFSGDTNGLYTHRSAVWIKGPPGTMRLGHDNQATDGIVEISAAEKVGVVSRPLSLRPIIGPQMLEVLDAFDGTRADLVRYDSPTFGGFTASASWASGSAVLTGDDADIWDVALRYAGEFEGFKVAAGIGYRDGAVVPTLGTLPDVRVVSGSASVLHIPTGLFVTGAAGQVKTSLFGPEIELRGWQVQGGLEEKWSAWGKTTLFAEYGDIKLDEMDFSATLIGAGVIQSFDAAALDLYLSGRRYESEDIFTDPALVGMAGARLRF